MADKVKKKVPLQLTEGSWEEESETIHGKGRDNRLRSEGGGERKYLAPKEEALLRFPVLRKKVGRPKKWVNAANRVKVKK